MHSNMIFLEKKLEDIQTNNTECLFRLHEVLDALESQLKPKRYRKLCKRKPIKPRPKPPRDAVADQIEPDSEGKL